MSPHDQGSQQADPSRWFESGLLLEDRHILLPWGARLLELTLHCAPTRLVSGVGWDELNWAHPRLLNGLRTQLLQVIIYPYGWFDSACIWLHQGDYSPSARRVFERTQAHLRGLLGPPGVCQAACNCEEIRDLVAWEQPHGRVSLFVRAGTDFDPHRYTCILQCHQHTP